MARNRCLGSVLVLALAVTIAPAAEPRVQTPGEGQPAVLEQLGALDGLTAIALGPGGERAAAAFPAERPGHSELRLYSPAAGRRTMPLKGVVRDLLYDRAPGTLYVLLHRPAKRREGDTTLIAVDLATLKIARSMRVPPSSSALDHWITKGALLLAARDEIRTIQAPAMRSGPLYRVPGDNYSVASVGGGSLILVGQAEGLLLVDLDDPPDEHQMPIRERIDASLAVQSLATAADGSGGLARLEDGSVWSIAFHPLRLLERGAALAVTAPPPTSPATSAIRELRRATLPPDPQPVAAVAPPKPKVPESASTATTEPPAPAPQPTHKEPPALPAARPTPTEAPAPSSPPTASPAEVSNDTAPPPDPPRSPPESGTVATPTSAPAPPAPDNGQATPQIPASPSRAARSPDDSAPAPSPTPAPAGPAPVQSTPAATVDSKPGTPGAPGIRGKLVGPGANDTLVVVLRGPNNILREAARLRPENGVWQADGLAPGRYHIQVESGSDRVLTVDPPVLVIDVPDGAPVTAPDFRVLR